MILRNRLLLVGFGIVVFLIATPILVLFASGFKIDWANHRIVKTGAFVIKTSPNKATVYLNNQRQNDETPSTIRFLPPGDYDVRIEKEGYMSWAKRLTVKSQFATWINQDRDYIALFYNDPKSTKTIQADSTILAGNKSDLNYVKGDQLSVYNVNTQETKSLSALSFLQIILTANSANTNFENSQGLLNWLKVAGDLTFKIGEIKKIAANKDFTAVLVNDQLYVITSPEPALIDSQVVNFLLEDENLWYLQEGTLKEYNLNSKNTTTVFSDINPEQSGQIIRGEGHTFLILDNALYAINDNLDKIYDGVSFANYDLDSHLLLFSNDHEILTYNTSTKKTDLILRSISSILNPVLNASTGYVFFQNEGKVKAVELDGRDNRNIYTIISLDKPDSSFAVSRDGTNLTVFSKTEITNYKIR